MPPVMFSVVTKYHKGRHSLFLYNSEIFYAFTQDILRSLKNPTMSKAQLAKIQKAAAAQYQANAIQSMLKTVKASK